MNLALLLLLVELICFGRAEHLRAAPAVAAPSYARPAMHTPTDDNKKQKKLPVKEGKTAPLVRLSAILVYILVFVTVISIVLVYFRVIIASGSSWITGLIPIYGEVLFLRGIGLPAWLFILYFVPYANLLWWLLTSIKLANAYDKDLLFGIGLALLPMIFFPILLFGSAEYRGPR